MPFAPTPEQIPSSVLAPEIPSAPTGQEQRELSSAEADRLALVKLQAEEAQLADTPLLEQAALGSEALPTPTDPLFLDIEKILAMDVEQLALHDLAPEVRERFLASGKKLALDVYAKRAQLKPEVVVEWIRGWLLQIPKVNKLFLAQDAYIKSKMLLDLVRSSPDPLS